LKHELQSIKPLDHSSGIDLMESIKQTLSSNRITIPRWVSLTRLEDVIRGAGLVLQSWDQENVPCIGCAGCHTPHPALVRRIIGTESYIAYFESGKVQGYIQKNIAPFFLRHKAFSFSLREVGAMKLSELYETSPQNVTRVEKIPDLFFNEGYIRR